MLCMPMWPKRWLPRLRPQAGGLYVDGVIHATRAVMGSMRARRYGRIVNLASIAAIGTALSGNAFYAATKAEVVILTRRFALELGQHGITVNAVAPGFVRTDMTQRGRGAADWPGTEERFAARAMMGRIGEPEDIANAVVFLASPESGWITAQVLTVDVGGWTTLDTVRSNLGTFRISVLHADRNH
jgi:3-oxoacyl-[acyl-carrier protein] reductase